MIKENCTEIPGQNVSKRELTRKRFLRLSASLIVVGTACVAGDGLRKIFQRFPEEDIPEGLVGESSSNPQSELEMKGVSVTKGWEIGGTYGEESDLVLTEEDTDKFEQQKEAILVKVLEELDGRFLEGTKELVLVLGSDENLKPLLVGRSFRDDGNTLALICPDFEENDDYQVIRALEPNVSGIEMHYQGGVRFAIGWGDKTIRVKQGWIGVQHSPGE